MVYSMHRAALPDGADASLIAISADGVELATAAWLQPMAEERAARRNGG